MVSRISVVAGVTGAIILGYCIYFDKKRRSDPEYRNKIKMRREKKNPPTKRYAWPDLRDPQAIQKFFMERLQEGEELIASGQVDAGTDCLARALVVCGQPDPLMGVLQQTLPTDAYRMLTMKLPKFSREVLGHAQTMPGGVVIEDLD